MWVNALNLKSNAVRRPTTGKTAEFRQMLENGAPLDDLQQAFAVARGFVRVLGMLL